MEESFPDKGCEHAPRCLGCPFDSCLYEKKGGAKHFLKSQRNHEIIKRHTGGKTTHEIATEFGVSERTIQRIIFASFNLRLNRKVQSV